MKSERSKPGRAELVARWSARGLTWIVASYSFWGSLVWPDKWAASDAVDPHCPSAGGSFYWETLAICAAVLVLAYFFELAAGTACLLFGGYALYQLIEFVWIEESRYYTLDLPRDAALLGLPLLLGALYLRAWLLGRRRVSSEPSGDPGGIRTGAKFILDLLGDAEQPPVKRKPEDNAQDNPSEM